MIKNKNSQENNRSYREGNTHCAFSSPDDFYGLCNHRRGKP